MMMSKKILENLVNDLKGKELNMKNINSLLVGYGFKKYPNVSILNGCRIDENCGWVELSSCNNRVRVRITNDSIVL